MVLLRTKRGRVSSQALKLVLRGNTELKMTTESTVYWQSPCTEEMPRVNVIRMQKTAVVQKQIVIRTVQDRTIPCPGTVS